jgi:hypothetical protein
MPMAPDGLSRLRLFRLLLFLLSIELLDAEMRRVSDRRPSSNNHSRCAHPDGDLVDLFQEVSRETKGDLNRFHVSFLSSIVANVAFQREDAGGLRVGVLH